MTSSRNLSFFGIGHTFWRLVENEHSYLVLSDLADEMSSQNYYIVSMHIIHVVPRGTSSLRRWKVAFTLHNPKGIAINRCRPENTGFSLSLAYKATCPIENHTDLGRTSNVSSILGRAKLSFSVVSFSL